MNITYKLIVIAMCVSLFGCAGITVPGSARVEVPESVEPQTQMEYAIQELETYIIEVRTGQVATYDQILFNLNEGVWTKEQAEPVVKAANEVDDAVDYLEEILGDGKVDQGQVQKKVLERLLTQVRIEISKLARKED